MLFDIKAQANRMGVSVSGAFDEYKNAKEILPEGYSLVDAAKLLKEKINQPDIRISDLAQQFYDWKEKSGNIDAKYLRHIHAFKKKIKNKLSINVSALSPKLTQDFIDDLKFSVSTKNHYVATFRAFINYAIDHGYLPSDTRLLNAL